MQQEKKVNKYSKQLDLTQYGVARYRRQCIYSPLLQFCLVFPHVFLAFSRLKNITNKIVPRDSAPFFSGQKSGRHLIPIYILLWLRKNKLVFKHSNYLPVSYISGKRNVGKDDRKHVFMKDDDIKH